MNKKRYACSAFALAAAAAMLISAGCSGKGKNGGGSQEPTEVPSEVLKQPLTFSIIGDIADDSTGGTEGDSILNEQDPTAPAGNNNSSTEAPEEATEKEYILLTDTNGENVTEYVPVTDEQGENVTDAQGQAQTEAVPVTEIAAPENNDEPATDSQQSADSTEASEEGQQATENQQNGSAYKANVVKSQAFWFDISKDSDYVFNGEFISVKFRIKDEAPEGAYDITITNPDFASYNEKTVYPDKLLNGKVYVGGAGQAQAEVTDADGFAVYADCVSGNNGDEVVVNFSMQNNPGMCAMIFEFTYDSNALEMIESAAAGEFAEKASPSL